VRAAVHGGFVLVNENKVTLASGVAELASEIDVARARRSLEEATERFEAEKSAEPAPAAPAADGAEAAEEPAAGAIGGPGSASAAFFDPASAEAAVRRATARLQAAGETIEQVA
jgi:F0F1-type ATP synthase epsilon subunit